MLKITSSASSPSNVAPSDGHHATLFRRDPHVLARLRLARVLGLRGHMDKAYAEARASFEMAKSSGAGITVSWVVHDALCPIALMVGDFTAAEAAIAAMSDWATRMNATLWKTMAACWKGKLLIERGEFAGGIELLSPALEACEQSGWQMGYAQFLGCVAEGLAGLGHLEEAAAELIVQSPGQTTRERDVAELARMKGEILLQQERAAEAEDCFRTANEIAREQGALSWELRTALSLARLRKTQGRHGEVRLLLAPIYERFTEGFDTPDLRAARALLNGPHSCSPARRRPSAATWPNRSVGVWEPFPRDWRCGAWDRARASHRSLASLRPFGPQGRGARR